MKQRFLLLVSAILLLPIMPLFADGGIIPWDYPDDRDVFEPSQTALIVYNDKREDLYIRANYEGEAGKFVWLVPTPSKPTAAVAPAKIFEDLSIYTNSEVGQRQEALAGNYDGAKNTGVVVHSQEQIGIYEVTVLSASGVDGLYGWLNENSYPVKDKHKEALDYYVEKEWYFTAMRINDEEEKEYYENQIEPIKISFNVESIVYPLKISQISTRVPESGEMPPYTNEILIYTLTGKEMRAPGFSREYGSLVTRDNITEYEDLWEQELDGLKQVIDKEYFLTKLRRTMSREEMDDDLYLVPGENKKEEALNVYFFWGEGCPHCENAKEFLDHIKETYQDKIMIHSYETWENEDNRKLFSRARNILKIDKNAVPMIFVGYRDTIGFGSAETSGEDVIYDIDTCLDNPSNSSCEDILGKNLRQSIALSASYSQEPLMQEARGQVRGSALSDRLKGKIVIKVEDAGKAYYINQGTGYTHFLGRPIDAFAVMREQGIGITNENLKKIPIGLSALSGADSDGDLLSDLFEEAIGTNPAKIDSDGDGYSDYEEVKNAFNPTGSGQSAVNLEFSEPQKGKIFLAVESRGEAWYVNPGDGKRYFLGRPHDAFTVMRELGLGISNEDFNQL